jgi:hypothetical protein
VVLWANRGHLHSENKHGPPVGSLWRNSEWWHRAHNVTSLVLDVNGLSIRMALPTGDAHLRGARRASPFLPRLP